MSFDDMERIAMELYPVHPDAATESIRQLIREAIGKALLFARDTGALTKSVVSQAYEFDVNYDDSPDDVVEKFKGGLVGSGVTVTDVPGDGTSTVRLDFPKVP
jgi:hypothetical protein